uniref:RING-type E3 ubiquitin transferase n=1 Tax=Cacopsylla melanoneura TaxID=428564 RepID=A0A8D8QX30_9HEMI
MSGDEPCVVCFKQVRYYSIGSCDHPVCYECCTRMRVLCQTNECPICRQDMQKVFFTDNVRPFKVLESLELHLCDRKYNIRFDGSTIQQAFNTLLQHKCPICPQTHVFSIFKSLEEHVSREHKQFYCDLCVKNLKIFSKERRCYERSQLSTHRRVGDLDDKSHKGHPLCEFCDVRYMDSDELYRHLRRDHFFCHFCDADGHHYYFNGYPDLRDHFLKEHYLCQEENCINEQFTSVFRSEIDLKAHQATTHGRTLGKAGTKQAKKLDVDLSFPARQGHRDRQRGNDRFQPGEPSRYQDPQPAPVQQHSVPIDINSAEFPSLGGAAPVVPVVTRRRQGPIEAFPALGPVDNTSANSRGDRWTAAAAPKRSNQGAPASSSGPKPSTTAAPGAAADFPSLPASSGGPLARAGGPVSWNAVTKTKKQAPKPTGAPATAPVKKPSKTVLSIAKNVQSRSNGTAPPPGGKNSSGGQTGRTQGKTQAASSRERYRDDDDDFDYNPYDDDISQYGLNSRALPPQGYSKVQLIKAPPPTGPPRSGSSSQNNMNYANIQQGGGVDNGETSSSSSASLSSLSSTSYSASLSSTSSSASLSSTSKKVKMKGRLKAEDFPVSSAPAPGPGPGTGGGGGGGGGSGLQYILPLNFPTRNASLFENIRSHIGTSFDQFKNMSSQFMRQGLPAEEYYGYVLTTLGRQGFNEVFPELLLLLPLIERQKDLWRVHHANPSAKNRKVVSRLDQCAVCGQIINSSGPELKHHLDAHKRAGVTVAPGSGGKKITSAWGGGRS